MVFANMQVWWYLSLCCAAVSAASFEQNGSHVHGDNGWYVPNLNGSFDWLDKQEAESYLKARRIEDNLRLSANPVKFYLYTSSNAKKGKKIAATAKSMDASNFNSSHPTRIVIHGWTQGRWSDLNKQLRQVWLSSGEYNVIIVDWARARTEYIASVSAVPTVGKKVANLIDFLVNNYSMPLDTLYVIGHSLGAHVAGYTGKNVLSGKIHAIIGLDPALPLFSYDKPHKRLSASDAFYVETIQTNGGSLGFLKPIGKATFYPNGGRKQPGCPFDIAGACAHKRSVTYYAEAVAEDNFGSMKCETYEQAVGKDCGTSFSTVRMGAKQNAFVAAGDFYVPVRKKAPFGMLSGN